MLAGMHNDPAEYSWFSSLKIYKKETMFLTNKFNSHNSARVCDNDITMEIFLGGESSKVVPLNIAHYQWLVQHCRNFNHELEGERHSISWMVKFISAF